MLEYGHIDIEEDVTKQDLDSLEFTEEVICYKQIHRGLLYCYHR